MMTNRRGSAMAPPVLSYHAGKPLYSDAAHRLTLCGTDEEASPRFRRARPPGSPSLLLLGHDPSLPGPGLGERLLGVGRHGSPPGPALEKLLPDRRGTRPPEAHASGAGRSHPGGHGTGVRAGVPAGDASP